MTAVWLSLTACCVAQSGQPDDDRRVLAAYARAAVIAEVTRAKPPKPMKRHPAKPVFVTIDIHGNVHGCRGSLDIRTGSLEDEIILSAREAAAHDPRYRPLTPKQLADFRVTITIVESKRPISDVSDLSPSDGLALRSGSKWGIVLPWEGKDPRVRLGWAYRKAGVPEGSTATLYVLKGDRFE